MLALTFNEATGQVQLESNRPVPRPAHDEALIRVLRAGICSTDLEICKGYVPGYHQTLGHEFVGMVEQCDSKPDLVGQRVVGEINCNEGKFGCADIVYQRNHAPGRSVLGIVNRDGAMAQYLTLPAANLYLVPRGLSDQEACYAEPLAAACRLLEQGLPEGAYNIAVLGDGKLGLLVAQALASSGIKVTLIGRHTDKMALVHGTHEQLVFDEALATRMAGKYDLVVEASGAAASIRTALALCRPMGTVVLKSTVALKDPDTPGFSELANDIVVNEKTLIGSRCGPFDKALEMLSGYSKLRLLVNRMTHHVFPIQEAAAALEKAKEKGVLKVQLSFD